MPGSEIRQIIINSGLKLWQVAYEYGITDSNFSRKLRRNFNAADTEKVLSIIDRLKNETAAQELTAAEC